MGKKDIQLILNRRGERLFRSLQKRESRKATERVYCATPKQIARAAVREHKKKQRAWQRTKRAYASLARATEKSASVHLKTLQRCFQDLRSVDPELAATAVDTLGNKEHAAIWLGDPRLELRGDSPYRAVASGRRDEVFRILNAIEHGFPA